MSIQCVHRPPDRHLSVTPTASAIVLTSADPQPASANATPLRALRFKFAILALPLPATKLRCCVCGTRFHGRSDACYCSGACRQKAYRARIARDGDGPYLGQSRSATLVARQLRKRSQLTRKEAAATLRKSAALRDLVHGDQARQGSRRPRRNGSAADDGTDSGQSLSSHG